MAYGSNMQPYDMVDKTGQEHSLAMIVHIEYGLMGLGLGCNGLPASASNPEAHFSVDDTTTVIVLRWSANNHVFRNGGIGRLYFDKSVTTQQRQLLENAFQGTAEGPLAALSTIQAWLPSARLSRSLTGIPAAIASTAVNITVPSTSSAAMFGTLNLQPRANSSLNNGPYVVNHRLLNCDPEFRRGGQNPDLDGITLTEARTANGISNWTDPAFQGFNGPIDLSGQGEIRDFEWQGADDPTALPLYLKATSAAIRESDFGTRLINPINPLVNVNSSVDERPTA
jgi:hypothetical protein